MDHQEEIKVRCPYCGEGLWVLVDCSVQIQEYVEDCQVCCQPIEMTVSCAPGQPPEVSARHQDET